MSLPLTVRRCLSLVLLCGCAACASSRSPTYFEAAIKHHDSGRATEARRDLQMEIEKRPDNLEARYDLAVMLENIGRDDEAQSMYEENMRRGMHLPTVVNLSALYLRHGNRAGARAILDRAASHFKTEAVPFYLLAEMADTEGDAEQAETLFRRAISADRVNGFARIRFARFLLRSGKTEEAQGQAGKAVELLPLCASCWLILGEAHMAAGQPKHALEAFQRSAAIEPGDGIRQHIEQARQAEAAQ